MIEHCTINFKTEKSSEFLYLSAFQTLIVQNDTKLRIVCEDEHLSVSFTGQVGSKSLLRHPFEADIISATLLIEVNQLVLILEL